MKKLLLSFVALVVMAGQVLAGDFTITCNTSGYAVVVEVVDKQNPQATKEVTLSPKESKTVNITGTEVQVKVFDKGMHELRCTGEFRSNANVKVTNVSSLWEVKE